MHLHILLVVFHVASMVASISLVIAALGMGLRGRASATGMATKGLVMAVAGTASGAILLVASPAALECAILSAYLLATIALYVYGFGAGSADRARLVRGIPAAIQKS